MGGNGKGQFVFVKDVDPSDLKGTLNEVGFYRKKDLLKTLKGDDLGIEITANPVPTLFEPPQVFVLHGQKWKNFLLPKGCILRFWIATFYHFSKLQINITHYP